MWLKTQGNSGGGISGIKECAFFYSWNESGGTYGSIAVISGDNEIQAETGNGVTIKPTLSGDYISCYMSTIKTIVVTALKDCTIKYRYKSGDTLTEQTENLIATSTKTFTFTHAYENCLGICVL